MDKAIGGTRLLFFLIFAVLTLVCPAGTCRAQNRLTVDRAVEIALENSLQRRMAAKDVEIAQEGLSQARAEFGPTVTLQGGLYRYDDPPSLVQSNQGLAKLNNVLSAMTYGQVAEVFGVGEQ